MTKNDIQAHIELLIGEIETLYKGLHPSQMRMGKQATLYYVSIKVGIVLTLIDYYKTRYKLKQSIIEWEEKARTHYISLRSFVYSQGGNK